MTDINGGKRKQYKSETKFKIVKEALTTDQGVNQICKKYGVSTAQFYRWQEIFFKSALEGFEQKKRGLSAVVESRAMEALKVDILRMKDVIAEVTAENIGLKKKDGGF